MAERKYIDLALQGGGSHGALTWGVLDRLLEDDRLQINAVSGTSAGAMNAVVLAEGLRGGDREQARQALRDFWRAVSDAARFSPIQRTLWDRLSGNYSLERSPMYHFFDQMTRVLAPAQFNPFDINPLRDLLSATIDFDAVNACRKIKVFVTATNVRTGRGRIFRQGEPVVRDRGAGVLDAAAGHLRPDPPAGLFRHRRGRRRRAADSARRPDHRRHAVRQFLAASNATVVCYVVTPVGSLQKTRPCRWAGPGGLVEVVGIEPTSASPTLRALHAYSAFNLAAGYPTGRENPQPVQ